MTLPTSFWCDAVPVIAFAVIFCLPSSSIEITNDPRNQDHQRPGFKTQEHRCRACGVGGGQCRCP